MLPEWRKISSRRSTRIYADKIEISRNGFNAGNDAVVARFIGVDRLQAFDGDFDAFQPGSSTALFWRFFETGFDFRSFKISVNLRESAAIVFSLF